MTARSQVHTSTVIVVIVCTQQFLSEGSSVLTAFRVVVGRGAPEEAHTVAG